VLIPLAAVFLKTAELSLAEFWNVVTAPRVVASYKLSFGMSLLAAAINAVFGLMLAWALVRYSFPGKKLIDALVDLPFALPTAVAGIALTALYAKNGWIGQFPRAARHPGRVQAARRAGGAGVHRPALRGAHGAADPRGPRHRSWKKPPPASARSAGRPSAT
jgi:ABC-type sulfate transport system, permease component